MDLTPANLLATLELAGSQHDAQTREQGEKTLEQWRDQPMLYILLQDAYLDSSLALNPRWLAIIYLKNKIKDAWRTSPVSKKNSILSDQQKQDIRQKLFSAINESNRQLQAQNADLIAKIARLDFPHHWPGLFDSLMGLIHESYTSNDIITLYNSLSTIKQVLKELSSVRIGRAKVQLQSYAPQLLMLISNIYVDFTARWTSSTAETFELSHIEIGYLALKVSSRLLYDGIPQAHRSDEARQFFSTIVEHVQRFASAVTAPECPPLVFKHLICIAKTFKRLMEKQGETLVLMPDSQVLVHLYLNEFKVRASLFCMESDLVDEELVENYSKFIRLALELIKLMIQILMGKTKHYNKTDEDKEDHRVAKERVSTMLNKDVLQTLINLLIVEYFRINDQTIEAWQTDPEDFFVEQELQVSAWEVLLRPCAAAVFTDIVTCFNEDVSDYVLYIINSTVTGVASTHSVVSREESLQLDCVLQALQYGYAVLFEKVDFNSILPTILAFGSREYADAKSEAIVARRILLVISTWVSAENLTTPTRASIYQFIMKYLRHPDLVVRLNSASTLRYAIDIYDFQSHVDAFLPFIEPAVFGIFDLLKSVSTIDCKVLLLQGLSVLVEQLGDRVHQFIPTILQILPALWKDAEEQSENKVMQGVVLQTLTHVVQALGWSSQSSSEAITECCKLGLPVLETILNPASNIHTYLYEDSLPLWQAYLEYCDRNSETEKLLPLVNILLSLMQNSSETLAFEATILELYMNFACDYFANPQLTGFMFQNLAHFIPAISEDILAIFARTVEVYVTLQRLDDYVESFFASGLFTALVKYVLNKESSTANKNRIYSLFARLAVSNAAVFSQLLDHAGIAKQDFATHWLKQFQNMGHPRDRKLAGLGMASMLRTGDIAWTAQLSQLLDMWCELFDEVNETEGDSEAYYKSSDENASTANQRRINRILKQLDPIHSVSLRETVRQALRPLQPHVQNAGLSESTVEVFNELAQ